MSENKSAQDSNRFRRLAHAAHPDRGSAAAFIALRTRYEDALALLHWWRRRRAAARHEPPPLAARP